MSDYSAVAPPQAFKSQAFAAALQRAKQIAAKINPAAGTGGGSDVGTKRPLDEGSGNEWSEPEPKKLATRSGGSSPSSGSRVAASIGGGGGLPSGMGSIPGGPVTSEDIKVPDKMVGLIIGRGGEQITRLQSESGCKIQMAPDSGGLPDRVCSLTGNSSAIARAKELINNIVHQRFKTEAPPHDMMGGPGGGGGGGGGGGPSNSPSFVEIKIPGPKVGLVIGKGGETIKMLQEKSGAKMVVIQDGPNQEVEKPLRITGDPQKVEHARQLVHELLTEKENQRGQMRGQGGGGRGGFNDRGGPGRGFPGSRGEESTYVVPAAKCGVIIGRGGETIKQINQTTGAHCELDRRPSNNPNEKVFIIRGTPDQIESAKQLIADKLGGGVGGGNGAGYGGGAGGPGGPQGYGQSWGPPAPYQQPYQHQPIDPTGGGGMPGMNPQTGQADYSQQWIEYYRSLGMHNEADAIEQQTKAKAAVAGGSVPGSAPGLMGGPAQVPQQQAPAQPAQQNGQPDYSAQWAQYYRSMGKIKEAELIEQQMKSKQAINGFMQSGSGAPVQSNAAQPQGGGAPQGGPPGGPPAPQFTQPGYYPTGPGFYPGPGGPMPQYQYPGAPPAPYQYPQPTQQPQPPDQSA